tara:strand:+ start:901 stop:1542 length:642 start_codon:yes stop_codon:yes gene_type:complete
MYKSWYNEKAQVLDIKEDVVDRITVVLEKKELTTDTHDFLRSLVEYYNNNKGLTFKQIKALEEIEKDLTPEGLAEKKAWKDSYDKEKHRIAKICANYYVSTKYFTDVSKRILEDDSYVLSEKTYRSMCENKYAKKILEQTDAEPLYPIGTLVKFRKAYTEDNSVCSVIGVDVAPITSVAKGAKNYLVLPFGSSEPITIEERYLKKYRKKLEDV